MKKAVRLFLVLFLVVSLNGCDDWDDWFGSDDDDDTTTTSDTTSGTTSGSGTEYATYFGPTNGGRPTFYFSKSMSDYPTTFTLTVENCLSATAVSNNGHRWEGGGWVLKQSEVPSRGMGLIGSGCYSTQAYITW